MKNALLVLISLGLSVTANAKSVERILKDSTSLIALDLNPKTVFCTPRGYGMNTVKISVPDLEWLAHLDHRVEGETFPCISGGLCADLSDDDVLRNGRGIDMVPMRVVLKEIITASPDLSCTRELVEEIHSTVRGKEFTHHAAGAPQWLSWEVCEKLLANP